MNTTIITTDTDQFRTSVERMHEALLNPLVLSRIIDFCGVSDLPNLRLVSKQWHTLTQTRFWKEMTVSVSIAPKTVADDADGNVRNSLLWKSLGEQYFQSFDGENRLRNWCLRGLEFCRPSPINLHFTDEYRNMDNFWRVYGPWIRKVVLVGSVVHCRKAFKKAIFEDTPNLEELELFYVKRSIWEQCRPGNYDIGDEKDHGKIQTNLKLKSLICNLRDDKSMPVSWSQLFSHFPNVQKLELNCIYWNTLLPSLADEISQGNCASLTGLHLTLDNLFDQEKSMLTTLLKIPELKLSTFHLEICQSIDDGMDIVSNAFLYHGKTLEKVLVDRTFESSSSSGSSLPSSPSSSENEDEEWEGIDEGGQEDPEFDQEVMDNYIFGIEPLTSLTELEFYGGINPNFHFLEKLPNLRVLKAYQYDFEDMIEETDLERMGSVRLPHLRTFHFDQGNPGYHIPLSVMEMFVKVMPNVETFSGTLMIPAFRVVCESWKMLKELELNLDWVPERGAYPYLSLIDDEAITGIVAGADEGAERLPNITDLKELRRLSIHNSCRISHVSVWNGFMKLPNLTILNVTLSDDETSIADEAFRALVERFPLGKISRRVHMEED